jgi:uncharacterized membrane protein YeaQ/YmgE (transglycosylase-associated protein family)
MNPSYGIILWIVVGALAGWLGSKIMGTDARQGALANIIVGVIGAVVGGFVARTVFGDSAMNNGLLASTLVALLGSVIVIAVWKAISGSTRRSL